MRNTVTFILFCLMLIGCEEPKPEDLRTAKYAVIYFSKDNIYSAQMEHEGCTFVGNAGSQEEAVEKLRKRFMENRPTYCGEGGKQTTVEKGTMTR